MRNCRSRKQGVGASESVCPFLTPLYINSSHSSLVLPLRRVNENARSIIIKFPVRQSIAQGLYERTKKKKKRKRKKNHKKETRYRKCDENMTRGLVIQSRPAA
ncbi:hypothetical protein ACQKWADRAFT_254358 [Trichoderma austrokoningii]